MYKRLAEVRSDAYVDAIREELLDRYGDPPPPVASLLAVARLRARARAARLTDVTLQGKYVRFAPVELPDSARVRLDRIHPKSLVKTPVRTILVPRPATKVVGGPPVRDEALLAWARTVIDTVIDPVSSSGPGSSELGEPL